MNSQNTAQYADASAPMQPLSANTAACIKKKPSGTTASPRVAPSASSQGVAASSASPPTARIDSPVRSLVRENELLLREMMQLTKERDRLVTQLEQMDALREEVDTLRSELGYATSSASATASRVVNYRKECELLTAKFDKQTEEYNKVKQQLDEAAVQIREQADGASSRGGNSKSHAMSDELLRSVTLELRKIHNMSTAFGRDTRYAFGLLQPGGAGAAASGRISGNSNKADQDPVATVSKCLSGLRQKLERYHQTNVSGVKSSTESEEVILLIREDLVASTSLANDLLKELLDKYKA